MKSFSWHWKWKQMHVLKEKQKRAKQEKNVEKGYTFSVRTKEFEKRMDAFLSPHIFKLTFKRKNENKYNVF